MRKMKLVSPLVLVLVLALMVGCQKPPQADIDAAKAALEGARAEASKYAPDSLRGAEDALAALETELKAQEGKFALFRSYKKTNELVTALKGASQKADEDAKAGKAKAKAEAETLIAEARTALDEGKAMLEKAPKGKGSQADLEMMKTDLAGAESAIGEADALMSSENYLDAKTKAEAAKSTAAKVKADVEAAIEAKKAGKAR